jgi:hypothetical protein
MLDFLHQLMASTEADRPTFKTLICTWCHWWELLVDESDIQADPWTPLCKSDPLEKFRYPLLKLSRQCFVGFEHLIELCNTN